MSGITLGHFLIGAAVIDVVVCTVMGLSLARRQAELPPEQRSPAPYIIIGAAVVAGIGLCLIAFYLPEAQLRII